MKPPTEPPRLLHWRRSRALVVGAFAEAGGGRVNKVAHPKVAHVGLDGVPAAGNERQVGGRVVRIEGRDLGVVSRRDEEAETEDESEDNTSDEANIPHARAFPYDAVRCLRRGRPEPDERRRDVNPNLLALVRRAMDPLPGLIAVLVQSAA